MRVKCPSCSNRFFTKKDSVFDTVKCFRCGETFSPGFNSDEDFFEDTKDKGERLRVKCPECKKIFIAHKDGIFDTVRCLKCGTDFSPGLNSDEGFWESIFK